MDSFTVAVPSFVKDSLNVDTTLYEIESVTVDVASYVMGYHVYKSKWTPQVGELLSCCNEPTNPVDKYALAVWKGEDIVGHLMQGKSGKFAKSIFYFMRASHCNKCSVIVTGNPVNLGKGEGMQVPCIIKITGIPLMIKTLQKALPDEF